LKRFIVVWQKVTSILSATNKVIEEAEILQEGFSLILSQRKTFGGQQ
jgi:hypothetical protein